MTDAIYTFDERLRFGKHYETVLDEYFGQQYNIRAASLEDDKRGVDRIFYRQNGTSFKVQYKADDMAASTKNFFIEVVSVDGPTPKPGWAFVCRADVIVLFVPRLSEAYVIKPSVIQRNIHAWKSGFGVRVAANEHYHTYGVPVPIWTIKDVAWKVITIPMVEAA